MSEVILNKPIVLVGMMGCGKSHIGKALAKDLGVIFCDSDSLIEEQQGKSIAQIFDESGEAGFREIEFKVIADLLDSGQCVISTGGGALTTPETLENVSNYGVSVWLNPDVETIWGRVKNDKTRPLLQCDNPRAKLEELLAAREHLYKQADIEVDNSSGVDSVIVEIKSGIAPFFNRQPLEEGFTP